MIYGVMLQQRKQWLPWVLLILTFTGSIALLTYAIKNRGVSHDGSHYLRVAQSFLNGQGFSSPNFQGYNQPPEPNFPISRPVGYPLAIGLVAGLFQIPVLLGVKVLSVLCAIIFLGLFKQFYGFEGLTIASILLSSLFLELYFSVLSGGLFTILLAVWVILLNSAFSRRFSTFKILGISVIAAAIFSTRYVGIVVLPILGLLVLYNPVDKQIALNKKFLIAFLGTTLLIGGYFVINYWLTGVFLPQHPFQKPSTFSLIGDYLWELFNSFNMLFTILYRGELWRITATTAALFLQLGIVAFWFKRFRPALNKFFPLSTLTRITWLTAIVYLGMLLAIFLVKYYTFSYRFAVPALMLLAWGGFHQVYHTQSKAFLRALRYTMFSIAIISVGFNGLFRAGYHLFWKPTPTFPTHLSSVKSKYNEVPKGAIVMFPEKDLNYLRTDLITLYGGLTLTPKECFSKIEAQDTNEFYLNTCDPQFQAFMQRTYPQKREQWQSVADTARSCVLKTR